MDCQITYFWKRVVGEREREREVQMTRVPKLIQMTRVGDECERKRAWREVGMEVGEGERQGGGEGVGKGDEDGGWEGIGKGDEDGGGHGGAG